MEPVEKLQNDVDPGLLIEAFQRFNETSEALEKAYSELQNRVSELNLELEEKNRTLAENLTETDSIRAHLQAVLFSMRDGVLAADLNGNVTLANEAAGKLFGKDVASMIGRNMTELLVETLGYIPKIIDTPTDSGSCECHVKRNEETAVYNLEQHRLKDSNQQVIGTIITLEDITQSAFTQQQQQRDERLAAMGKMAVNIVHEIRNPMGSIELLASLLRQDLSNDPPKRDLAERISVGIRNLNHIIENLLTFARDREPAMEWVRLDRLIDDSVAMVEPMLLQSGIRVSRNDEPGLSRIRLDRELFKQALLNLLINAAHAMPDGGELRIATNGRDLTETPSGRKKRFIQLRIADTGSGISPDHKARIFDPFFTTREKGTGLGLALVHKIVQAHDGIIGVDSTLDQGTIFTIMLPAVAAKETSDDQAVG
jgi:PAS domain S-box-containing protein